MEAFSLLKYWRGGGNNSNSFANGRTTTPDCSSSSSSSSSATTTIVTTVSPRSSDDDDGPFFDFEFTLPDETENAPEEKPIKEDKNDHSTETINIINVDDCDDDDDDESEDSDDGDEEEVNDQNISLSPPLPLPSDENLFFKGGLVPIEPSSLLEGNPKFPISLSKSAAKFRVLMLKFKKSKENIANDISSAALNEDDQKENESRSRKFLAVKFIKDNKKVQKSDDKDEDEHKFSKDVMQKYLKMVKPLHIRVSKLRFSGQLMSLSGTAEVKGGEAAEVAEVAAGSNVKSMKQVNVTAGLGLRVVCKRLGKSKSASLATAPVGATAAPSASRRRDDSLLQQQDGIQSAILHCKRSFNASGGSEGSILSRSASDPSNEKSIGLSTEACCSEESKVG